MEGRRRARLIVGSGNLTAGGLYSNYELAMCADLDLSAPGDEALLSSYRRGLTLDGTNVMRQSD